MRSHTLALLLALVFAPVALAADPKPLRAGAAAVDITPTQFPVNMPGGFLANLAEKAHDPLHVRTIVLDDGKTTIALVLVDSLGVSRETADEAKLIASRRVRILQDNILLSSTHTHSAPPANVTAGAEAAVSYRQKVIDGIVESIVKAHKALRPAAVGHAAHPLPDEVFNRRWFLKPGKMTPNPFGEIDLVRMNPGTSPDVLLHPAGPTDPDITILSVEDAKTRRPLALYANYSLHYVGGTPRAQVSADYFGEFARLMPNRLRAPEGFVAMMTNGTSGDINNIPFGVGRPPRETFEQIRLVAAKAADTVWHARQKIKAHVPDAPLKMLQKEIVLKTRRPTEKQINAAKTVLAIKDPKERDELPRLADHYARRVLALAEGPTERKVLLQVIQVGDLAICAIPFETFAEIGLNLKKRSPFPQTLVVGLANGYEGYLPTPQQHKLGGYETWMGTNRVQHDASEIITKELLDMLDRLKK